MTRTRNPCHCASRDLTRRLWRELNRGLVRGQIRGPDELAQALVAYTRALRCYRRLARLAPRFFDSVVVDREARERERDRRWMALWEPALRKAYGPAAATEPATTAAADRPPLPGPRAQRAIKRELAGWNAWLAAASLALDRYQVRRPHALPSFCQIVRLHEIAFELRRLACGCDSLRPEPDFSTAAFEADLRRAYGAPQPAASPAVTPPSAVPMTPTITLPGAPS